MRAFTPFLQADHAAVTAQAAPGLTICPMSETTLQRVHRNAGQLFVAAVTVCLLALVISQATRGPEGLPGVLVYAVAAGFGLESTGAAWSGRWRRRAAGRRLVN